MSADAEKDIEIDVNKRAEDLTPEEIEAMQKEVPIFGMWAHREDMKDVAAWLYKLQESRFGYIWPSDDDSD